MTIKTVAKAMTGLGLSNDFYSKSDFNIFGGQKNKIVPHPFVDM